MSTWLRVDISGIGWPPPPSPLRAVQIELDRGKVTLTVDGKLVPVEQREDGVWRVKPFLGSIGTTYPLNRPLTADERAQVRDATYPPKAAMELLRRWGATPTETPEES